MEIGEMLCVTSLEEWRQWLAAHHRDKREIWLVCRKVGTGRPSLPYNDSVEEAICLGWVDGMKKPVDGERYVLRFTPRRKGSKWSESQRSPRGENAGRRKHD